jgi:hypothetical protein
MPSFQDAWQAYEQAVNDLYTLPAAVAEKPERGEAIYAQHLEERGDAVVARAADVREALAANLEAPDVDRRELAALKLLATASYDLSIAGDILALEEAGPSERPERSARGAVLAMDDLRSVLEAPLEAGLSGLLEAERAVLPDDPQAARALLEKTIAQFLQDIPDDAASLSQSAVVAMGTISLGTLQSAAVLAGNEILARVPGGVSIVVRRVANLIVEAILKLQTAIGPEQEQQIREQVLQWLDDIQKKRDTVIGLLNKLYETPRIGAETRKLVAGAPASAEAKAYNQATQTLEGLLAGYEKTRGTLNGVLGVLTLVKAPLLAAVPWGPLAVYAAYVAILGYAVYSGGDYLDWYRTGQTVWLDRVPGLRTTVQKALK